MSVNIFLIFIFDLARKIMQNPKSYIIYMNVTERSENTPGRVDSGADLTSGRVDPLPYFICIDINYYLIIKTTKNTHLFQWSDKQ